MMIMVLATLLMFVRVCLYVMSILRITNETFLKFACVTMCSVVLRVADKHFSNIKW